MTTEELRKHVCEANLELVSAGLVIRDFGNASGIDRNGGNIVIKPSGLSYDEMKPEHMVIVSLETGEVVEGDLRPSSDTPTHLELYRAFGTIGGIVHTHSLGAGRQRLDAVGYDTCGLFPRTGSVYQANDNR